MSDGAFSHVVAMRILDRDNWRCFRCGKPVQAWQRGISWSLHHRRPRSMGGTSLDWVGEAANGVVLCGSGTTGCHGWAESHRRDATALGYLVSANTTLLPRQVSVMRLDKTWWRLSDTGGIEQTWEGDGEDQEH